MNAETLYIIAVFIPNQIDNSYLQLKGETIVFVKERKQATPFSSSVLAMGWIVQAQALYRGYRFSLTNIVSMVNS